MKRPFNRTRRTDRRGRPLGGEGTSDSERNPASAACRQAGSPSRLAGQPATYWRHNLAPLLTAWGHRELIVAVLRRELSDRFSGSAFGWVWAVAGPLITLAIYTLTFTRALHLPVASAQGRTSSYALSIFVGLIVFGVFGELCCRAPLLLHEHAWFLKTSIFPSETLAWTAVLRAMSFAGISVGVLLAFQFALSGTLPITVLLLPLIIIPLMLLLLGIVWFLAALGAFTRDIAHLMFTFVPLVMFATPVFYRASDLPYPLNIVAYLNPLGTAIESARAVLLGGSLPPIAAYLGFVISSLVVCRGGYAVFRRYKGVLVDVI
jgi:lipopolysaccharide transport system permease protein